MKPYLFVHVPKTAGTSLKKALLHEFSQKNVLCDYGQESPYTTDLIKQEFYIKEDVFAVAESLPVLICGHFYVKKYLQISRYENLITFVRHPVDRVVSEFKHFKRHHGFKGGIIEFAQKRRNINVMSNYFTGHPWQAYGFIGIAEQYDESINVLNRYLGRDILTQELNRAPDEQQLDLTDEEQECLFDLNRRDCILYQNVVTNFNAQKHLFEQGKPVVSGGWKIDKKHKCIEGFAFYHDSGKAVDIDIMINGCMQKVKAKELHPIMHRYSNRRSGYVGFSHKLNTLDDNDITCSVAQTQQVLQSLL